jgi:hypothetical protein
LAASASAAARAMPDAPPTMAAFLPLISMVRLRCSTPVLDRTV